MKKRYLLTILYCLIAGFARAATVSGAVYDMTNGVPLAFQAVSLSDTLHGGTLWTTTDAYGVYSFTLPASSATAPYMWVSATSTNCSTTAQQIITLTGGDISTNLYVCESGSAYVLNGEVKLSNGTVINNGPAIVYVISVELDPVTFDTLLVAVDSIYTAPTGGLFSKLYVMPPTSALLLKAVLLPSHPLYSSYPPAYHVSNGGYSNSWSTATHVTEPHISGAFRNNIQMAAGVNPGGLGFIGGNVLLGANKGTASVGDPLSHRILLLTTSTGQMVGYTYSDASGHFQFSNLAYGSYKLYGDAPGKTNPALLVTLSNTKASVNDVIFDENSETFKGRFGKLGVGATASALSDIHIYPNPVHDKIQVSGLTNAGGKFNSILTDLSGKVLNQSTLTRDNNSITTAHLPPGIYFLRLQNSETSLVLRFMK